MRDGESEAQNHRRGEGDLAARPEEHGNQVWGEVRDRDHQEQPGTRISRGARQRGTRDEEIQGRRNRREHRFERADAGGAERGELGCVHHLSTTDHRPSTVNISTEPA